MGAHSVYIWSSYALVFVGFAVFTWLSFRTARQIKQRLRQGGDR